MVKTNQKGFSALIVLLIVIIIGVVGLGSWYFLKQKDEKSSTTPDQTAQIESQNPQEQQADPSEGGKYLVIKEWNVRFVLPSNLSDAKYRLNENGSSAILSTSSLEKYDGCQNGSFMALQRAKEGEPIGPSDVNSIKTANSDALTQVGEYYYLFTGAQLSCTQDPAGEDYLGQTITEFSQAVKSLQAI